MHLGRREQWNPTHPGIDGSASGRWFHSSQTSTFKEDVEGKNVLMVGGELSVEDLALMAIKQGARKIYVTARDEDCVLLDTKRWPYDKLELCEGTAIREVNGRTITLHEVSFSLREGKYLFDEDEGSERIDLPDIDTVIFCTGYKKNLNMLDPTLYECLPKWDTELTIPKDWEPEKNELSKKILGKGYKNIRPKENKVLRGHSDYFGFHDDCFESCFNIKNQNMMFLQEVGDTPLMCLEVTAWMIAKVISNQIALPSPRKMREENAEQHGLALQNNTLRYDMDLLYREAIDEALEKHPQKIPKGAWDPYDDYVNWRFGMMTIKYDYPVKFLDENDTDEWGDYYNSIETSVGGDDGFRANLDKIAYDTKVEKDGWRTFRDLVPGPEVKSFFTGIRAIPLPKPWEELHEDDILW